jgi:hypothetical protein
MDRRIILRGRGLVRRRHRGQVQPPAGLAVDLRGVDEAIAAHPDLVAGLRKVGQDVAALVVGHDHARELGGQIVGLGDHPDAGLRTARTPHDSADIVVIDRDRLGARRADGEQAREGNGSGGGIEHAAERHGGSPALVSVGNAPNAER